MTKSKLCWLLQKDQIKLNSDVRERFIEKKPFELKEINSEEIIWKGNIISRGHWVVVNDGCDFIVGFVVNFQKMNEKSKAQRMYRNDSFDLTSKGSEEIFMLLDPSFKIVKKSLKIIKGTKYYFCSSSYLCHVLNDGLDFREALVVITKFYVEKLNK